MPDHITKLVFSCPEIERDQYQAQGGGGKIGFNALRAIYLKESNTFALFHSEPGQRVRKAVYPLVKLQIGQPLPLENNGVTVGADCQRYADKVGSINFVTSLLKMYKMQN